MVSQDAKLIAFYLPQFHPIPENDKWWGKGFTEWTNVRKATPLFSDHYQPHVPESLGYYDLRDPRVRNEQVALAKEHGIHGFCYYHYWFNGKRLLETPFNEVLRTGEPDFPFCLCWANENWTRRWDGGDKEVLVSQCYSPEDDSRFIEALVPAFRDERYIRINGKPLFIVYCTDLLPDPKRTSEIWREQMHRLGVGNIYLVKVERHVNDLRENPAKIGFDAAIEFAPNWGSLGPKIDVACPLYEESGASNPSIYDYENCMYNMMGREVPDYKLFRGIFPSWDNAARRTSGATTVINSSPEKYAFWLSHLTHYTLERFAGDEQLIFVNAWNEWAEGCHLEPDQKHGLRYLEAGRDAVKLAGEFHRIRSQLKGSSAGSFPYQKWHKEMTSFLATGKDDIDIAGLMYVMYGYLDYQILSTAGPEVKKQLQRIVARRDDEIANICTSASWRITAPLRKLRKFLAALRRK